MGTAAASPNLRDRAIAFAEAVRDAPLKLTLSALALTLLVGWQTYTAPPWTMDTPPAAEGLQFIAADGTPIGHRGAEPRDPVDATTLPPHVRQAFMAIEDRRFESHGGVDVRGLARAMISNVTAGGVVEGGSTITQQYVKNAYLNHDRTVARKLKEVFLADWIETWSSKDEIFARYLENIYFGEGQTGLVDAAHYYFGRKPEELDLGQAAMLAGLVKAPSNLSPLVDREASVERMRVVLGAMADAGFISQEKAKYQPAPPASKHADERVMAEANWFVDWVANSLPDGATGTIETTLDPELQKRAERAIRQAPLGQAEVALIAMRPDGRVVAMVGGKEWQADAFNRAVSARRQPGSTFKLFDYLAAVRDGARPDDTVLDAPLDVDGWKPENGYSGYRGAMTLVEAFGQSSNTAAVRVAQTAGYDEVRRAAKDLGVESDLPDTPSLPLGTAEMNLAELAAAYAAFAGGRYPVKVHGLAKETQEPPNELDPNEEWAPMMALLWASANEGTGRRAALSQPTFGKTGTTQDGRDALFVGFAGDLVAAVWIGRDDNKPVPGASGGKLPAEIWRAFMTGAALNAVEQPYAVPATPQRAEPRRTASPKRSGGKRGKGKRGKGKRGKKR